MFLKIKYLNFLYEKQKNNVEKLSKLLRQTSKRNDQGMTDQFVSQITTKMTNHLLKKQEKVIEASVENKSKEAAHES